MLAQQQRIVAGQALARSRQKLRSRSQQRAAVNIRSQTAATLAATRPVRRSAKAQAQPEQQSLEDEQAAAAAVAPSGGPLQSWVSDPVTAYTTSLCFLLICIGVFGEDHLVVAKVDAPVHAWVSPLLLQNECEHCATATTPL